eukprot:Nitzschia sp. Nitz4//scaffold229_size32011//28061//29188//NITZ4_007922-RA/size32011-processed-gene-0.17-mRNA-1//-1//CDS//3329542868//9236//frame0
MNHPQIQNIFDSVCRCFGHTQGLPTGQTPYRGNGGRYDAHQQQQQPDDISHVPTDELGQDSNGAGGAAGPSSPGSVQTSSSQVGKRRTNRLGLQDQQWDELFERKNQKKKVAVAIPDGYHQPRDGPVDLTTAQALAKAKIAANPPRYTPRSKRKRSGKTKEEIFRSKDAMAPPNSSNPSTAFGRGASAATTISNLLHPSLVMCFATPVREQHEEMDESDIRSVDNSDANTLNTCEDTITSTVYYESKIAHMTETRPPMPLFHQFKIGGSKDEIQHIVASDSHSSVNMIRLLNPNSNTNTTTGTPPIMTSTNATSPLEPEGAVQFSQGEFSRMAPAVARSPIDEEMEDAVPGVKAVSDSSGSDASLRHRRHSPPFA